MKQLQKRISVRITHCAVFLMGIMLCCGCMHRSSVLLFVDQVPPHITHAELPEAWQGRLIRSRDERSANTVGGQITHTHYILHTHTAKSEGTANGVRPLGIRQETVDYLHQHAVESTSTEPSDAQSAEALPPSFGLRAVVLDESLCSAPRGLIIGYLGSEPPTGWSWCDGSQGAPDLRDRYIRLNGKQGPDGATHHAHEAPHRHTWATAENVDHPAFFRNQASPEPSIAVAPRVHRHAPGPETTSEGHAEPVENSPVAFGVRFIMATAEGVKIPRGALVPYIGTKAPWGWSSVGERFGKDAVGRLLRASWNSTTSPSLSGSLLHAHKLKSTHEFTLLPVKDHGGSDAAGDGPVVPAAEHSHRVHIEDESETGTAETWPPFVDLLLIIKS